MQKLKQAKIFSPQVKVFALFYFAYAIICVLTFFLTKHHLHQALLWNLFLAFLPLLFSSLAARPKLGKGSMAFWLILWLLFFPNAIYVITDIIHLSELTFYSDRFYEASHVVYSHNFTVWLELATTALGVFLALIMGMLSLLNVHKLLDNYLGKAKVWLVIVGVSLLSGLAIYIGRFLRFNSWDVLVEPWNIVIETLQSFDLFAVGFILLFALFTIFGYGVFYQLVKLMKK